MYTFQKVNNPNRAEIRNQYIVSANDHTKPPLDKNGREILYKFKKDECVNFGQFFNSVFEDEVTTIAGLPKLTLELTFSGSFYVRIFRDTPGIGGQVIYDEVFENESKHKSTEKPKEVTSQIEVELKQGKGSRLRFEIVSSEKSGVLYSASWNTDVVPSNTVKLAIITTTFKNEKLIDDNLKNLLNNKDIASEDIDIVVIDNASSYKPNFKDDRLHLIGQDNVGGAGGFTRGMYEVTYGSLSNKGYTHVLLMDDDIKLHLSSIIRIATFYKYSQNKITLGGSMLDLNKPDVLFEAGAFSCRHEPVGSHNDVSYDKASEFHNLDAVGQCTNYDYCGWWFYSFPISAIKEIGLPKSVFIRGDDVDYGERLNQAGYKVYCLGGVGVWHLHFLEKPISWIVYYVFRNHLVLLSTSHKNRNWDKASISKQLRNTVFYNLCQYDYGHAALVLLAIEDFLKGPEYIQNTKASDILQNVLATYKKYNSKLNPECVKQMEPTKRQADTKINNYLKKISLNYQQGILKKKGSDSFEIIHGEYPPSWKQVPEKNGYILHDTGRNVKRIFERNQEHAENLDLERENVFKQFSEQFNQVAEKFLAYEDTLHSKEYWEDYFKSNQCL